MSLINDFDFLENSVTWGSKVTIAWCIGSTSEIHCRRGVAGPMVRNSDECIIGSGASTTPSARLLDRTKSSRDGCNTASSDKLNGQVYSTFTHPSRQVRHVQLPLFLGVSLQERFCLVPCHKGPIGRGWSHYFPCNAKNTNLSASRLLFALKR
eukprot:3385462-Rhodomonas_salina.7